MFRPSVRRNSGKGLSEIRIVKVKKRTEGSFEPPVLLYFQAIFHKFIFFRFRITKTSSIGPAVRNTSRCHRKIQYHSYSSDASLLPMRTPMADAIIRPLVQPEESPRQ